jgi:hypothetical protein
MTSVLGWANKNTSALRTATAIQDESLVLNLRSETMAQVTTPNEISNP